MPSSRGCPAFVSGEGGAPLLAFGRFAPALAAVGTARIPQRRNAQGPRGTRCCRRSTQERTRPAGTPRHDPDKGQPGRGGGALRRVQRSRAPPSPDRSLTSGVWAPSRPARPPAEQVSQPARCRTAPRPLPPMWAGLLAPVSDSSKVVSSRHSGSSTLDVAFRRVQRVVSADLREPGATPAPEGRHARPTLYNE